MGKATPHSVAQLLMRELKELGDPLDGPEREAELLAVQDLLESHPWTFAKTMPQNPHWYTLIKDWEREAFYRVVASIRRNGEWVEYRGWPYIELPLGEHFYWTMGWPIHETTLINRKPLEARGR